MGLEGSMNLKCSGTHTKNGATAKAIGFKYSRAHFFSICNIPAQIAQILNLSTYFPTGLQDRAARKLFTTSYLKPSSKEYINVSQKLLSGTAARYAMSWLAQLCRYLLEANVGKAFYEQLCRIEYYDSSKSHL